MTEIPRVSKGPANAPVRHDKVRLVVFLYRKEGMSADDFHTYWHETHSHVFAKVPLVKKNLLKYEQVHCNRDAMKVIQDVGFTAADYDGMAIYDAASIEKLTDIFESKEYKEEVVPDEENFLNRQRCLAFPAEIVSVLSDPS